MLVQNKLSKKYGLAYVIENFMVIKYENGTVGFCCKSRFKKKFIEVKPIDNKILVYIVNGAYFTNKLDADWHSDILEKNGYSIERSFIYDTPKNIIERISHVQN